jgi:hypothetical protein
MYLTSKAQRFARALIACPLGHFHSWLAYFTVFIPGITYLFPTTSLTEAECIKVEKIVKIPLLQKMGLPPTLPNEIVYGDQYFGGIGILCLFAEQGMIQVLLLMQHLRAKTELGEQITIGLRAYQLQSGLSQSVLVNTRALPYVYVPWFATLRQYLWSISAHLELTHKWIPKAQRENDQFLMEMFLDSNAFTNTECMSPISTSDTNLRDIKCRQNLHQDDNLEWRSHN